MDFRALVVFVSLIYVGCCLELEGNGTEQCHGKSELLKVDISKFCSQNLTVDYGVNIVPTSLSFSVLQNCLNCSLILRTRDADQLTATFFSLGTETSPGGECTDNRLDIYDGDKIDGDKRLSNASGICGCNLPNERAYETTHNAMLLHFFTKCSNETVHGEFELVVAAVKNENFNKTECHGKFECSDGHCVDKNLICNGKRDCPDGSDEQNCTKPNSTCAGQFECLTGQCIDKNLVCDGKKNCPNGSDEFNCTSHGGNCSGKFECTDGQCIDKNLVCNGKNDCKDKSDEKGCTKKKHSVLVYVLLGLVGLVVVLFIVIVILLCYRWCCSPWHMAAAYRRI